MFEYNQKGNWFEKNKDTLDKETRKKLEKIKRKLELAEGSANMENFNAIKQYVKECEFEDKTIKEELKKDFVRVERAIDRSVSWEFAYFLRYYRRLRGYSLKELEEKTGITASYINRLERGYKKAPSLGLVEKLAEGLEIPVYVLLGGSEEDIKGRDISEIIFNQDVTFLGKEINMKQRAVLMDIINFILDEENWRNNYTAGIELMSLVDKFYRI